MKKDIREVSVADWHEEGRKLFGKDKMDYAWRCPSCGAKILSREYMAAGAPSGALAVACIGNFVEVRGCFYSGGGLGLTQLNPVQLNVPGFDSVTVMDWWEESE